MILKQICKNTSIFRLINNFNITNFKPCSFFSTHEHHLKDSLYCFSEDEKHFRDAASKFSKTKILPHVQEMEEKGMPDSLIAELFDHGFMSVEVSHEYGGSECNFFSSLLVIEEIAKVDMGVSLLVDLQNTLHTTLMRELGTKQQKDKYLTRMCTDLIGAFCLSEEHSGSDAFALKTTAIKKQNHFIINGTKMWISNALQAGVFLVMANAEPDKGYKGITCFIVDKDTPGLTVGKKENKMGLRSSSTCSVHFDNVVVPEDNMLGKLGHGYKYAITLLNGGRIGIGAQLVGVSQGCLDHTIPYLLTRKQFGKKIFDFQSIQHQVAQISTKLEAARLLVYNAGRLKDKGLPYIKEASMAKYYASEIVCETTSKCIEWLGAVGFSKSFPVEKYYRDCKVGTIYEGTSNIQLNNISKFILKHYEHL